ncbi:hypothetical protein FOA52_007398 [Chlamydomonas sp. UWO 241]|nr:hypothetical protein FOA52_007398 [Chlamydomonas sp. UWO 241]
MYKLLVLLLAAVASLPAPATANHAFMATLMAIDMTEIDGGGGDHHHHEPQYFLRQQSKEGGFLPLWDPNGLLEGYVSNTFVKVVPDYVAEGVPAGMVAVKAISKVLDYGDLGDTANLPINDDNNLSTKGVYAKTRRVVSDMSTLFYILDFCGLGGGAVASVEDFEAQLLDGDASLSDFVDYCSIGQARLSRANSRAVKISLPCNGTSRSTGRPWDATLCSGESLLETAYEADWVAANLLNISHQRYVHHILVYPRGMRTWGRALDGSQCTWAGNAALGMAMGTWSYVWVAGDYWGNRQLYLHEIGHNYRLGHASTFVSADSDDKAHHGDWSSAMGYCCSDRCFNAPNQWQMGWSTAVVTLDGSVLTPGAGVTMKLPAQGETPASFAAITSDWTGATTKSNIFVSYRLTDSRYDVTQPGYIDGLLVHEYDGTVQSFGGESTFRGFISRNVNPGAGGLADPGDPLASWVDDRFGTGLVVTLLQGGDTDAWVWVCRQDGASGGREGDTAGSCHDGVDNDCNGAADEDDPACARFLSNDPFNGDGTGPGANASVPAAPAPPLIPLPHPRPAPRLLPQTGDDDVSGDDVAPAFADAVEMAENTEAQVSGGTVQEQGQQEGTVLQGTGEDPVQAPGTGDEQAQSQGDPY